ncbi:MAG TPA: GNAT family N-acetyltransferase [Chloroflexia bacterium]|nr:GNAT family N-acetyltransferase [Chloroflexia bacterium]
MALPGIESKRLLLVPFSLQMVEAALDRDSEIWHTLSIRPHDEWPGEDIKEELPLFAQALGKDPTRAEWGRIIIHAAHRMIIGDIGFQEPPDANGTVEMGYSIVPSHRKRGYATEAGRAIIAWAFSRPEVGRVTANCLQDNHASIRVLEKLGMKRMGMEDGMLKWEIGRNSWSNL